jgi:glycosyltransferase involved in cell wall biosynthesis
LVYAVHDLVVGGAQDLVKTLAMNVGRDRYEVTVVTASPEMTVEPEPLADELTAAGIEVVKLNLSSWVDSAPRDRFIKFMADRKFDVAHSHLFPMDLWTSRAARLAGVPVRVYSKHESYTKKPLLQRLSHTLKLIYNSDLSLATSRLTRDHLVRYEFFPPWRVRVVPNPVDADTFRPDGFDRAKVREELGIPMDAPVVGNIVRLVRRKGVESFIDACGVISKRRTDCRFLLVGDGYLRPELEARAERLGLKNIIFTGMRRDVGELLASMDVFLFTPYWGEALPLVMLDAMCMQKGIVASNVCSNNELIEDGVSGFLPTPSIWKKGVEALDPVPLAEAAIRMIDDREMLGCMGESARTSAVKRFSIDVVMRAHESIYEELLKKKGVRL